MPRLHLYLATLLAILTALPSGAASEHLAPSAFDTLAFQRFEPPVGRRLVRQQPVEESLAGTELYRDVATGEIALAKGPPVPLVPAGTRDAAAVEAAAAAFLETHRELLTVPLAELRARGTRRAGTLWVITWEHAPEGVVVEGSRLTLVVGHGNLILWGSEGITPLAENVLRTPAIGPELARIALEHHVKWNAAIDGLLREPRLLYLPEAVARGGLGHRLVWELEMERRGERGSWRAHVDARTGELLSFADANRYAWVRAGIYPVTWTDQEESRPLPFVTLSDGRVSTLEGQLPEVPTSAATASLEGLLVTITNQCEGPGEPGAAIIDASPRGDFDFGLGPTNPGDADCATNAIGLSQGLHNTHAARTAYDHATRIKDKSQRWLPDISWLGSPHEVQVNLDSQCNAFWNGTLGINGFYRQGFLGEVECFNTGENGAIVIHEVGHGLDQHDAQGLADRGTGEAYADVHALLELRDSCLGRGFLDRNCGGFGLPCNDCTGARELDYAKHRTTTGEPWTQPLTPANFTGVFCPNDLIIPAGPCGKQVHCEASPMTGAIWDLAVRQLSQDVDLPTAWAIVERDWYLGMQAATSMFSCDPATFASNGCAATSWFHALLAADDDDGDLTNGTPHAARIFAALDAHAVACGTASDPANQSTSSCPVLAAPVATATPGAGWIDLAWTAVPGAAGYTVLRNHGDCSRGSIQLATLGAGTTTYRDAAIADHQTYAYRVVALAGPSGLAENPCFSALSNCTRAGVFSCPATLAAAPALSLPGANQVAIGWNTTGSCAGFSVYRKLGGCEAPGVFAPLAQGIAGPGFLDTTVSGRLTYGYRLAALDPTGQFETALSPCAEIVPSGICHEIPSFEPALAAADAHATGCAVELDWQSGSTVCPEQPVVYNLYRGSDPEASFESFELIASGLATPGYRDVGLEAGPAVYVVRAEGLNGAGPGPNGGIEDANEERVVIAPTGPHFGLFRDDVEDSVIRLEILPGPGDGPGTTPWGRVNVDFQSPTISFFVESQIQVKDEVLATTVPVTIPEDALLRFWHRFDTESFFDGGVLEYTLDGERWVDVLSADNEAFPHAEPSVEADEDRIIENGYTSSLSTCCLNPLPGRLAWTGMSAGWQRVTVDLAGFAGETVRFRWRFGCDGSRARVGWWVDDVEIVQRTSCTGGSTAIFNDGFEAGTIGAWSVNLP